MGASHYPRREGENGYWRRGGAITGCREKGVQPGGGVKGRESFEHGTPASKGAEMGPQRSGTRVVSGLSYLPRGLSTLPLSFQTQDKN